MTHSATEQQAIDQAINAGEMFRIDNPIATTWSEITPLPKNKNLVKVLVSDIVYRRTGAFIDHNQKYTLIFENKKKYLFVNTSDCLAKFQDKKIVIKTGF